MEINFAPGPWRRCVSTTGEIFIEDANSNPVARVSGLRTSDKTADVLAAAPDLLKMLEHVVRWFDQLQPVDVKRYQAVIAKARGQS